MILWTLEEIWERLVQWKGNLTSTPHCTMSSASSCSPSSLAWSSEVLVLATRKTTFTGNSTVQLYRTGLNHHFLPIHQFCTSSVVLCLCTGPVWGKIFFPRPWSLLISAEVRPSSSSSHPWAPCSSVHWRSGDHSRYDQSEAIMQVMWSLSANQRSVSRSDYYPRPIRGQYPGHVITLSQSEASILSALLAKHEAAKWSRAQYKFLFKYLDSYSQPSLCENT